MNRIKRQDPLEWVLYLSILGLIIGLGVALFVYKVTFPGDLSTKLADWSSVGSFFGGIFAPAVSFVTLVAIIITIRLQKIFLETQVSEFSKIHELQDKTLKSQEEQLLCAKVSSEHEKVNNYKQTLLNVIAQKIDLHQKIIDRCASSSEYMLEKKMAQPKIDLGTKLEETLDQKEEYEKKLNQIVSLSVLIATSKYESVNELDKAFAEGFLKV